MCRQGCSPDRDHSRGRRSWPAARRPGYDDLSGSRGARAAPAGAPPPPAGLLAAAAAAAQPGAAASCRLGPAVAAAPPAAQLQPTPARRPAGHRHRADVARSLLRGKHYLYNMKRNINIKIVGAYYVGNNKFGTHQLPTMSTAQLVRLLER